jgi:hypothetical protein
MGIILDASLQAIIQRVLTTHGEQDAALSVVTFVELTHLPRPHRCRPRTTAGF